MDLLSKAELKQLVGAEHKDCLPPVNGKCSGTCVDFNSNNGYCVFELNLQGCDCKRLDGYPLIYS